MELDEDLIKKLGAHIERASWFLVLCGMLSQISSYDAFPSYNMLLGFWGAYATFTRHGKATFGYIAFTILAFILDIVFISINESENELFRFAEAMFIICMLLKVYSIYYSCQFFGAIGGAAQIDPSILQSSRYSTSNSGGYNSQSGFGLMGGQSTAGGYYNREQSPASLQLFEDNESSSGLLR